MNLDEIYSGYEKGFLSWKGEGDFAIEKCAPKREMNRVTLGEVFEVCVDKVERRFSCSSQDARIFVRNLWRLENREKAPWDLPAVVGEDPFVRTYAKGTPLSVECFKSIWKQCLENPFILPSSLCPIFSGKNPETINYFDVKATPPGLLPKFFSFFLKKKDPILLSHVQSDLRNSVDFDTEKRRIITLAILAFGASYRELDGKVLQIPSWNASGKGILVPYAFSHHFIWEGIKTVSARPLERETEEPGFYLCQGTEIWPSQPSMLGSMFANLGKEGSATEPYAHCWRQIHKHLRDLAQGERPLPVVTGHSMGGAFATQIALYSHSLIDSAYAFNPPVVEKRDYQVFHRLSKETQEKVRIFANLDDLPFWRIGSKVIGKVTLFLSAHRWTYRPLKVRDLFLVFPACIKFLINFFDYFPAHQSIFPLSRHYLVVPLSEEEIEKENQERLQRRDHLTFFPKLYQPTRSLLHFRRRFFRWKQYENYLRSQIEIIELHEQDLLDTWRITESQQTEKMLHELQIQKEALLNQLNKIL